MKKEKTGDAKEEERKKEEGQDKSFLPERKMNNNTNKHEHCGTQRQQHETWLWLIERLGDVLDVCGRVNCMRHKVVGRETKERWGEGSREKGEEAARVSCSMSYNRICAKDRLFQVFLSLDDTRGRSTFTVSTQVRIFCFGWWVEVKVVVVLVVGVRDLLLETRLFLLPWDDCNPCEILHDCPDFDSSLPPLRESEFHTKSKADDEAVGSITQDYGEEGFYVKDQTRAENLFIWIGTSTCMQ